MAGVFSKVALSLTDLQVEDMRRKGLVEVLEWDDGPDGTHVVHVYDEDEDEVRFKPVRTRSRPAVIRLSTDGWAVVSE